MRALQAIRSRPSVLLAGAVAGLAAIQLACARPSADKGRGLYRASGCISCHGPDGRGDGPVAHTLRNPPRDLRDLRAFEGGTSETAIADSIGYGLGPFTGMPAFNHLTPEERHSLALFIRSLADESAETRPAARP